MGAIFEYDNADIDDDDIEDEDEDEDDIEDTNDIYCRAVLRTLQSFQGRRRDLAVIYSTRMSELHLDTIGFFSLANRILDMVDAGINLDQVKALRASLDEIEIGDGSTFAEELFFDNLA